MGNIFTSVRKVQGGWGIVFMREGMCVWGGGGWRGVCMGNIVDLCQESSTAAGWELLLPLPGKFSGVVSVHKGGKCVWGGGGWGGAQGRKGLYGKYCHSLPENFNCGRMALPG